MSREDCVTDLFYGTDYANEAGIPFGRPFVRYSPTWPRSFMPQDQRMRELVAGMKLIPIRELIEGKRWLFCEDSIVRRTQLRDTVGQIFAAGAREVHMRPASAAARHFNPRRPVQ